MSVAVDGRSERKAHTQSGPSTTSSSVISATSPAGIKRLPIVKKTKPRPICVRPSVASNSTSTPPACTDANGAAPTSTITCERHIAGAIETSRRCRAITIMPANDAETKNESDWPSALAWPGPPAITAPPATATAIAAQVRRATGSPSSVPSAAAKIGARACQKSTFATDAWFSATKNAAEADRPHRPPPARPLGQRGVGEQPERREERPAADLRRGRHRQLALQDSRRRPRQRGKRNEQTPLALVAHARQSITCCPGGATQW